MKYISPQEAAQIDAELMSPAGGFQLEQLVELAGLACAQAFAKSFPGEVQKVLVACGPGNQGADGLCAARHLLHFGYRPTIFLPKLGKNPFYQSLKTQAENLAIPVLEDSVDDFKAALESSDVVLDAIFGFSFKPPVREPFGTVLALLANSDVPIFSVDIPSGWDVEHGPPADVPTLKPHSLISLTAPKRGVRFFAGERHWLGGRFIPPSMAKSFTLDLPPYPSTDQVVEIPVPAEPLQRS